MLALALWSGAALGLAADTRSKLDKDMFEAARKGQVERLRALLQSGASIHARDGKGRTALIEACKEGRLETARVLIQASAEVGTTDRDGNSALMEAANSRQTALMLAAEKGHSDAVSALLRRWPWVDVDAVDYEGRTALMLAAIHAGAETVKRLLQDGHADVDQRDDQGKTALIHAAEQGRADNVRALIDGNADLDRRDRSGKTALDHARAR